MDAPLPVKMIALMDAIIRVQNQPWNLLGSSMVRLVTVLVRELVILAVLDSVPVALVRV